MSERITGELRRKMDTLGWYDEDGNIVYTTGDIPVSEIACLVINSKTFDNLCDAIDAVHKGLERENESLRRELDRVTGEMEEHHAWAPESHYVMLPKDADGEPINIGDVMENIVCPSVHREVMGVGVECFYGWDDGNGRYSQFDANCYRHHHAPTVEDVLRGVVTLCRNTWKEGSAFEFYDVDDVMKSGNIAEYAAKLRLAGDAE